MVSLNQEVQATRALIASNPLAVLVEQKMAEANSSDDLDQRKPRLDFLEKIAYQRLSDQLNAKKNGQKTFFQSPVAFMPSRFQGDPDEPTKRNNFEALWLTFIFSKNQPVEIQSQRLEDAYQYWYKNGSAFTDPPVRL